MKIGQEKKPLKMKTKQSFKIRLNLFISLLQWTLVGRIALSIAISYHKNIDYESYF